MGRGGLDIFNNYVRAQELLTRWRDDDDDEEFGGVGHRPRGRVHRGGSLPEVPLVRMTVGVRC